MDKALQAERDGLWGRAYFDARGLTQTQTNYWLGDEWILGAAQVSRALGFETVVDDTPDFFPASFPMSQIAIYAGWYVGQRLRAVPIAEGRVHARRIRVSSALVQRGHAAQHQRSVWCGPFLAKGATCTMGCVYEPYLSLTPNVAMFLERFTIAQFTFGEAAWAAQPALSWQTTVVGDPLYRPFAKPPMQLHQELTRAPQPARRMVLPAARERGSRARPVRRLPGKLDRNHRRRHQQRRAHRKTRRPLRNARQTAPAIDAYERALTLNPSPEQRIRLRLALADKLMAQNFTAAARRDYQKLLEESPDYPGKAAIEEKINALGQKLHEHQRPAGH